MSRRGPGRWRRLLDGFRPPVEEDVHDEVDFHIAMRARDNERAGMDREEARREAERRFGDRERVAGEVTGLLADQARTHRRREWLGGILRDVRIGTRALARRPGYTAAVVLTLALGIGATTAIFSVAEWAILRPLPGVAAPEELITVRFEPEARAGQGVSFAFISHADASDLTRAPAPAVAGLTASAFNQAHVVVPGGAAPERRGVEIMMAGYFQVLGVIPTLGRTPDPLPGEDPRIVMLGHRYWQEAFGGARSVIGTSLEFNGDPFTVVGVAPADFRGASYPMSSVDAWIPIEGWAAREAESDGTLLTARNRGQYLNLYGRLSPGAAPSTAEAQLRAARRALVEANPGASRLERFVPVVTAGMGLPSWTRERITGMLKVLGGVVLLLLVLAVANAANLVLARGYGRRHELAVRRAIGAGRGRLVRQLVTEGTLLGATAGVVGVGLAGTLLALFHGQRLGRNLPPLEGVALDGPVLLFAAGTALLTGILFSVVPALLA
ncbi:MAG: ABC transporter permease, partial [Gemmatimonadota bacterium]